MNKRQNSFISILCGVFLLAGCATQSDVRPSNGNSSERRPQSVSANPGVIDIQDPSVYSQVVVISDVHGMYDQLLTLLRAGQIIDSNNNWIAKNSLLIVTGDSIDKGPKSIAVLNLWIKLQSDAAKYGSRLIHVLGNHEAEFLADPQNDAKAAALIQDMQNQTPAVLLSDLTGTQNPLGVFIHNEPLAARVGLWLFCHSGFYPDANPTPDSTNTILSTSPNPMSWIDFSAKAQHVLASDQTQGDSKTYRDPFLTGLTSILEAKAWEKNNATLDPLLARISAIGLYGIVFGHQPTAFGIAGRSAAKADGHLIKIDNGMPPEGGGYPGSLLVFTTPSQMTTPAYPQIKIILPDGSSHILQPE